MLTFDWLGSSDKKDCLEPPMGRHTNYRHRRQSPLLPPTFFEKTHNNSDLDDHCRDVWDQKNMAGVKGDEEYLYDALESHYDCLIIGTR